MVEEYQLRLLPEEAYSEDTIRQYLSQEKGFDVAAIRAVRVVKRSIDARHRRPRTILTSATSPRRSLSAQAPVVFSLRCA